MISRLISAKLIESPKSVLLLGPRQVGKSTLIQSLRPDLAINLNDDKTFLDFKSNPSELAERISASNPVTIFIDEIQRHPSLLNTIQTIIDADKKRTLRFYITGSSARKLKRGQANLLPGRIFSYQLAPLCAAELDYNLDVLRALKYGALPEPYLLKNENHVEKLLSTYSAIYLREEIQAEALTRNLEGFSRFIVAAAENSGHILDFSKIAKQAKIERKLCSRFYEILEDTLIANQVSVFEKANADIKKRPKYYFFDTGVLNGLLENYTVSNDRKGFIFEHLVYNQLINSAKARDKNIKIHYFRTRAGYEVDFIVELEKKIYAIEAKTGPVNKDAVANLERFNSLFKGVHQFFIVCPNSELRKVSSTIICGLNDLLKRIGL